MTQNRFDQAARYAAKRDPAGLARWLLGAAARFHGWRTRGRSRCPRSGRCSKMAALDELTLS